VQVPRPRHDNDAKGRQAVPHAGVVPRGGYCLLSGCSGSLNLATPVCAGGTGVRAMSCGALAGLNRALA
jgi:hypothetical protein